MKFTVGVDIGGTFTDCVISDEEGKVVMGKSLSTPGDYSSGVLAAIEYVASLMGMSLTSVLRQTELAFHGTTIAENTLVTFSGANAGLITTKGFEDTLVIARGKGRTIGLGEAELTHPVKTSSPTLIIPRSLTFGVSERVDSLGRIILKVSSYEASKIVKKLLSKGVNSVAISLLWSFKNPANEVKLAKLVRKLSPKLYVTTSAELVPIIGEFERMSTVAINAYVGPIVSEYLDTLERKLSANGFKGSLMILQAYGGALPPKASKANAVGTIESGPVAGVSGSKYLGKILGFNNIIACDMGGTTFKVGVIADGVIQYARESVVLRYPTLSPKLDIASIGAGGGSIVWIEETSGLLKVGPYSAGAKPGPVCYDLGGDRPTVTDANLLLGYLDPDYFLGGRIRLNRTKTIEAFKRKICKPLGMDVDEAAAAVSVITNSQLSDLIAKVTVERGYDPRDFVVFSFGGAAPLHAGVFAKELGIRTILVPASSPVQGAFGALTMNVVHEYSVTDIIHLPTDPTKINANFEKLEKRAVTQLSEEGFKNNSVFLSRSLDIRYRGQVHETNVPFESEGRLESHDLEKVYRNFEKIYEKLYGKGSTYRPVGIEITNFRLRATGEITTPSVAKVSVAKKSHDASDARKGTRNAYFDTSKDFMKADVYDYTRLSPGLRINGPALIETPMTTIVINPDQFGELDEYLNMIIRM